MSEAVVKSVPPASKRVIRTIAGATLLAEMLSGIATVLGFMGSFAWPLDLCSHFRVQYLISLLIGAVILLAMRRRTSAAIFGLLAIVNLAVIVPLYFGRDTPSPGPSVRAMLMNVNTQMGDPKRVAEAIRQIDPDFVVLEEISSRWITDLADTVARYPHSQITPRDDNFGIALLSRFPFESSRTIYVGPASAPSIIAEIETPQGKCTVMATHPPPPIGGTYAGYRNAQFVALSAEVRKAICPVLLLGDLNCTPWSPHFARLLVDSGLKDSTRGWGVQPSWPADNWLLRIPIDQCLHSPSIRITRRAIGPDVGSDHFPLIVEFQVSSDGGR